MTAVLATLCGAWVLGLVKGGDVEKDDGRRGELDVEEG